ncbi:MAG TPA: cytochrome c oxidase subunit 3, partial [Gemmatimonadales bacterium]|nr:cytochrome c oxidase subunit 3 [Gemmatimonadales bacterium]
MTAISVGRPAPVPIGGRGRRSVGWWGMVFLVVNEASFFVYLLVSYFYLGSMSRGPWPPGGPPELTLALPNTFILLASSGALWWSERRLSRGETGQFRLGLLLTFLLGIVFIAIQGVEYSHKQITPQSNAYGSLFFTVTGFHGAHVCVGLLMLLFVQLRAWLGHFTAERHDAVVNVSLYWH